MARSRITRCLRVSRHPQQNAKDHDRDQGHGDVEQNLTGARLFAHFPVGQLFAIIGNADLLGMLQVMRKLACRLVTIGWIALHRTVDDFL